MLQQYVLTIVVDMIKADALTLISANATQDIQENTAPQVSVPILIYNQ